MKPAKPRHRHTPLASRYLAGRRYEYKVKKQLEAEGWTVLRTAGSHGDADLVAYKPRVGPGINYSAYSAWAEAEVSFIQCKVTPTKADRDKIDKLRRETGLDWRLM